MNLPEVSDFVVWHPNANPNAEPLPALVEKVHETGMLSLNVSVNGQWIYKPGVWHKDAKVLTENIKIAIRDGMWESREDWRQVKQDRADAIALRNLEAAPKVKKTVDAK